MAICEDACGALLHSCTKAALSSQLQADQLELTTLSDSWLDSLNILDHQ